MCGICGVIQIRGEQRHVLADGVLDRMTDAMAHRGPNDRGTHVSPGAAIGARRLSVVDVEGGHQPFSNEDGTIWAVQNGELYNHAEIREDLRRRGHRFASRCDTEILPHVYEEFGPMFAEQLRGMFGIAVWDQKRRRGVVARDRLGIKPIYYAVEGDLLVFASELKSLLASGLVSTDLDYEAIDAYLTLGFFPAPATPLASVKKLEPGCILVVEDGTVEQRRFWSYPRPTLKRGGSLEDWSARLLAELEESVRLRLMADVPLGAMLSGGLDSSLIVALMAKEMDRPVQTFAVGFSEAGEGNELADARFVANTLGADHHELELSFAEETISLDTLLWHLDEPLADLSSLGFIALSGLAAKHVTVALTGQGADELLGGYRKHRAASIAGAWQRVPAPLRRSLLAAARRGPGKVRRPAATLAASNPAERLLAMSGALTPSLRRRLVRGPLAELDGNAALRAISYRLGDMPDAPLPAALYLDGQLGLADDMLHYFDRASMAHSLEVRVPFLDHQFVEFCATHARRPEGPAPRDQARSPPRRARSRPRPDHRQAEDRFLQLGGRRVVSRADAGRDQRLPPRRESPLCRDDRPQRGRAPRQGTCGRKRRRERLRAALDPDARGLALGVPAARALDGDRGTREYRRLTMRAYAVITPVRDESENLPRLAASLAAQTELPRTWVIVDNGSQDGTLELAHELAAEHDWIRVLSIPGATAAERGAPIVRALHAAVDQLASDSPDFVVNVDADISMEPDYFALLLDRFDADPSLGIASGSAFELQDGDWRQRHVTGSTVWGASRAFRWPCLQQILPFEERVAWDGIDEFKANARGWRTRGIRGSAVQAPSP